MKNDQLRELLYQALETELGGVEVYQTAITCASNRDLKKEWERYLEQTNHHVEVVRGVLEAFDLNPDAMTPGRGIVRMNGRTLVKLMQKAQASGDREAAQLVAAECVVTAETKDNQNWALLEECGKKLNGAVKSVIEAAVGEVKPAEDEQLYHSQGWVRELWIKSLGMKAVLPPPEEKRDVKTAIGAARARQAREQLM